MSLNSTNVRFVKAIAGFSNVVAPGLAARLLEQLFLTPTRHKTPAREVRWIAGAQRSAVRFAPGRELPVYTWGSGPPVLLVHGWSGRGSQLGAFIRPLVSQGFRVVTFDGPSHGQAGGRLSGIPEFARAIELLAQQLGPFHAVVAHSMGAAATTVALSRGLELSRVVYVAPPENPGRYLDEAASYLGFSDGVVRRTRARIERRFSFDFKDVRGSTIARNQRTPLLVIHDRDDREVLHEEGARLVDAWPGARLLTTSGLGHRRILRDEDVVDAMVRFVGEPGSQHKTIQPTPARQPAPPKEQPMRPTHGIYDHLLGHLGMRWDELQISFSEEDIWADLTFGRDDDEPGKSGEAPQGHAGADPTDWMDGAA